MEASNSSASLVDDDLSNQIGGQLSFSEESNNPAVPPQDIRTENLEAELDSGNGGHADVPSPWGVAFEVDDYRFVEEGRSKYVLYSVIIRRTRHIDSQPTIIERRYSDFEKLYSSLKKKFPKAMQDVSFPKKLITGNFKPENIAQRSRAFEQFLSHIYSIMTLRCSQAFVTFFYGTNLKEAYKELRNSDYESAISHFKSCLGIQRKLLGDSHSGVVATLCGLCAASNTLEETAHAQMYAELALQCLGKQDESKYLVPLLQLSIRLCWQLGKDKTDLEKRLGDLRSVGLSIDSAPTLLEVVVTETG